MSIYWFDFVVIQEPDTQPSIEYQYLTISVNLAPNQVPLSYGTQKVALDYHYQLPENSHRNHHRF